MFFACKTFDLGFEMIATGSVVLLALSANSCSKIMVPKLLAQNLGH